MKTIVTLIATLATTIAFATEPVKPAAPVKEEMKLAKKKEGSKQDSTKSSKTVKDKKATTKTEPAKAATK
jgi:hypothetical protein